jgi:hypothetical protein
MIKGWHKCPFSRQLWKAEVEAFQMRELQNRNLEADLKRMFLAANPAATENSWLLAKD